MALMLIASYGFMLTRIRPNIKTITAVSLSSILILLYRVTPDISVITLIMFTLLLCFISNEKAIEAFIILFILPILLYLCMDYSVHNSGRFLFFTLARFTGLALIAASTMVILLKRFKNKRMISFAFFYIGHYLFAIGVKTPEATALAVILMFLMPFIYSTEPDFISVFNLAMLPVSPSFILKIALVTIAIQANMMTEAVIIIVSSLIVMTSSISDLSNIVIQPIKRKIHIPLVIQVVSVTVLLLSIIYLDTVKNVVKITIKAING